MKKKIKYVPYTIVIPPIGLGDKIEQIEITVPTRWSGHEYVLTERAHNMIEMRQMQEMINKLYRKVGSLI